MLGTACGVSPWRLRLSPCCRACASRIATVRNSCDDRQNAAADQLTLVVLLIHPRNRKCMSAAQFSTIGCVILHRKNARSRGSQSLSLPRSMFLCVRVLDDQVGATCLPSGSCIVAFHDEDSFQSVFDRLKISVGLAVRRVQLKACADTPDSDATEVPDVASNVSVVVKFIQECQRSSSCICTFVVTRHTAAEDAEATAAAPPAPAEAAAEAVQIEAVAVPPALAAAPPEAAAAETADVVPDMVREDTPTATSSQNIHMEAAKAANVSSEGSGQSQTRCASGSSNFAGCYITQERAKQLYSSKAQATSASLLARFLFDKGCLFWATDSKDLQEFIFMALNSMFCSVTPSLKQELEERASTESSHVRKALQEANLLLGLPVDGQDDMRHILQTQAEQALVGNILSIASSKVIHRCAMNCPTTESGPLTIRNWKLQVSECHSLAGAPESC